MMDTRHLKRSLQSCLGVERDRLPIRTAIVRQHPRQGQTFGQVLPDRSCAMHTQPPAFSQHHQAGDMVDLRIHEQHCGDACVARRPPGLQRWRGTNLGQNVRRRIDQKPVQTVGRDGNGRLRARQRTDRTRAITRAIAAVAIPLRETASGRGAKHDDSHERHDETGQSAARNARLRNLASGRRAEAWRPPARLRCFHADRDCTEVCRDRLNVLVGQSLGHH